MADLTVGHAAEGVVTAAAKLGVGAGPGLALDPGQGLEVKQQNLLCSGI